MAGWTRTFGSFMVLTLSMGALCLHAEEPSLVVTRQVTAPVLTIRTPEVKDNKFGFEGGRVIKLKGTYHMFTSEMVGDPHWVKMKLAYWISSDKLHWRRVSTLLESSGDFTGKDQRAALWSPMPVFDAQQQRWNLFYVAYQAAPDTAERWLTNHEGRIWRAVSTRRGMGGIGGPYRDVGVILERGAGADSWEGLQGTDSFFPYQVNGKWYALYGSARTERLPIELWQVGLAEAPALGGPWKRCSDMNPLSMEKRFIENPIVSRLADGTFIAVYDNHVENSIGYAFSKDGVHWGAGRRLAVQSGEGVWASEVRTPLGLVEEGNGLFTLFYSANEKVNGAVPDANGIVMTPGSIGVVEVRLKGNSPQADATN